MANKDWHGINDFYFVKKKDSPEATPEDVEAIDEPPTKEEPELKISKGVFVPGPDGFDFLKECSVKVMVEFLKEGKKSAEIEFTLFSNYGTGKDAVEYDHKYQVRAHTNKSEEGAYYAEAKIPKLWYDENYYNDSEKPADATCEYFFKSDHPRARERKVESEFLEMPQLEAGDGEVFYDTRGGEEEPVDGGEIGIIEQSKMNKVKQEIEWMNAALEFGTEESYKWDKVTCKEHDAIIEYLKKQGAKSGKELVEE